MELKSGVIEVDLFAAEVDSPDHPEADSFRELLEEVAAEHDCRLISFAVHRGTVTFSFDSDELMAEVLKVLSSDRKSQS